MDPKVHLRLQRRSIKSHNVSIGELPVFNALDNPCLGLDGANPLVQSPLLYRC